ncbi:MAG: DNA translocase FtsK 4TM domain-containing protein [Flavitalea sp.]
MANRLKSPKKPKPDPEQLKPEKEEQVTVKELVKDERTHKIAGSVSLLVCLLLFVAFTSYLFTWRQDQDKVFNGTEILMPSTDVKTENLLGNLGAYISHNFFYNGFGIASYLFCTLFFVLGINALAGKKIFSIARNVRYLIVGLVFFSVASAFVFTGYAFPWGGALGDVSSAWLVKFVGWLGTAAILSVAGFAYFIWRFNPVFKMPERKKSEPVTPLPEDLSEQHTWAVGEKGENIMEESSTGKGSNGNSVKPGKGPAVILPSPNQEPVTNFELVEREPQVEREPLPHINFPDDVDEEEEEDIDEELPPLEYNETDKSDSDTPKVILTPVAHPVVKMPPADDLALEIKSLPGEEDDEAETPSKKIENLEPYDPSLDLKNYKYPGLEMLETHGSEKIVQDPAELETNKNQIINTLKNYDISIQKISATVGPTVTLYEIVPAAGVRISRIKNLEDDIALSLAALGIRIIAPIPGKGTIGIEVPNVRKTVVSMKSLLASEKFQHNSFSLPIAIGKKIDNENFIVDLAAMPHLLMAGATGQGKSVGLNAILVSLLYKKHPSQLKLVLVDPKKVELSLYRTIENHFLAKLPGEEEAIITDTKKVINTLNALCIEMDNRYDLLKEAGARNIKEYNEKFVKRRLNPEKGHQFLPFIVLVVDEFADLIMTAGKEVEMPIARLAQLARAVGIHLIIATQRPSVNIITGTIKANFPARIAFKVSSKIDSRTILDTGGAEQLIGKGDMLISYNGEVTRLQCAFVDTPEVEQVCDFIGDQRGYPSPFLLPEYVDEKELDSKEFDMGDRDSLFEDAARIIVQNQVGSTSLLQRRMKLGYNRAGRLMDQLEAAGIVGQNQGSKAREVLIKTEMDLEQHLQMLG